MRRLVWNAFALGLLFTLGALVGKTQGEARRTPLQSKPARSSGERELTFNGDYLERRRRRERRRQRRERNRLRRFILRNQKQNPGPVLIATPAVSPTASPTTSPTASPTSSPTASPTSSPTASPTSSPTASPTSSPTASPTSSPTSSPTASPTSSPTASPTSSPTASPTSSPTASPTTSPTASPTSSPTASPTSPGFPISSIFTYEFQLSDETIPTMDVLQRAVDIIIPTYNNLPDVLDNPDAPTMTSVEILNVTTITDSRRLQSTSSSIRILTRNSGVCVTTGCIGRRRFTTSADLRRMLGSRESQRTAIQDLPTEQELFEAYRAVIEVGEFGNIETVNDFDDLDNDGNLPVPPSSAPTTAPSSRPSSVPSSKPTNTPTQSPSSGPTLVSPLPDPIHRYRANGDATDSESNSDGVLGSTTSFDTGITGLAFNFDTQRTSAVELPGVNINPSNYPQLTMGLWFNLRVSPAFGTGWAISHDDGGFDRAIILNDSRYFGLAVGAGLDGVYTSTLPFPTLNEWHCAAVAYDEAAGTATVYFDGQSQVVPTNMSEGRDSVLLGGNPDPAFFGRNNIDGLIDEVFIFDQALTPDQMNAACIEYGLPNL